MIAHCAGADCTPQQCWWSADVPPGLIGDPKLILQWFAPMTEPLLLRVRVAPLVGQVLDVVLWSSIVVIS